jgi:trehalose 6-phosphate synthase
MILSEFAGAAQSLNGSIVVNPWDSQQVADAIHEAVTMSPETRADNHKKLFKVHNLVPCGNSSVLTSITLSM